MHCFKLVAALTFATSFGMVSNAAFGQDFDDLIDDVQRALLEYGYDPGEINGQNGNETQSALKLFLKEIDFGGEATINPGSLAALGVAWPQPAGDSENLVGSNMEASVLVVPVPAAELAAKLQGFSQVEFLDFLPELYLQSQRKVSASVTDANSIVFVVYGGVAVGDEIHTYHSTILDGQTYGWSEEYNYIIKTDSQVTPLVIVNEFRTSNPFYMYQAVLRDGRALAYKYTRVE